LLIQIDSIHLHSTKPKTTNTIMATRMASSTASATLSHQPSHHIAAVAAASSSVHGSTRHHSTTSTQVPNRFTQAFQEMKEVCPNSISLYASCVLEAERSGQAIEKHSCSNEFRQVKDCFRKIRGF
jgi:hypothetical protein